MTKARETYIQDIISGKYSWIVELLETRTYTPEYWVGVGRVSGSELEWCVNFARRWLDEHVTENTLRIRNMSSGEVIPCEILCG